MAIYAIGDIQGCYDELRAMLEHIQFDAQRDKLWLVGDIVNRGPKSLETLRFVKSLGDAAICILGNHDLHLLALAAGNDEKKMEGDLNDILRAEDRKELLTWLRQRPLMHRDEATGFTILHAGLPPQWDMATALSLAHEVEDVLRDERAHRKFLYNMYGNKPDQWDKKLSGMDRLRFITNCLTRLRFLTAEGKLGLKQKGAPGSQEAGFMPWYSHPQRKTRNDKIIFGHWSLVGYQHHANTWAIDSGCLWGGMLTALRVDGPEPIAIQLRCPGHADPKRFV